MDAANTNTEGPIMQAARLIQEVRQVRAAYNENSRLEEFDVLVSKCLTKGRRQSGNKETLESYRDD